MWWNKKSNETSTFIRMAGAGLSRVLQHMTQQPFAIISGHTGTGQTQAERQINNERMKKLKQILMSSGKGWIDTGGAWTYRDENMPPYPVKEHSLFIPNISKAEALQLGKMFDQEGVIVGGNGKFEIVDAEGTPFSGDEGTLKGNILDQIKVIPTNEDMGDTEYPDHSNIKGKKFTFEPDPLVTASSENYEPYFYYCYADNTVPKFVGAKHAIINRKFPVEFPDVENLIAYVPWYQESNSKRKA